MSEIREVNVEATVRIAVSDAAPADWLSRCGDDNFPYKDMSGRPMTPDEGLEHLAYNAIANGVRDASRLDGWADLERGVLTMDVTYVDAL